MTTQTLVPRAAPQGQAFPHGRPRLKLDLAQPCQPIAADGHFALLNPQGTMDGNFSGYYVHETRMLDRLTLLVDGKPLKLRDFRTNVYTATCVYTNEEQTLLVERNTVVNDGIVERLTISRFSEEPNQPPRDVKVEVFFGADFRAMGEIRDMGPTGRGTMLAPSIGERAVRFAWEGQDMLRTTTVRFARKPEALDAEHAEFTVRLAVGESTQLEHCVSSHVGPHKYSCTPNYEQASKAANEKYQEFRASLPIIETGSPEFNSLFNESIDGLYMLRYVGAKGRLMAAGLPWYFCLFGRDICIWILQCGWALPELAKAVLESLQRYQATVYDEWTTEAKPGKIPHERREDQLGNMHQIVYWNCCWAVDTAPLYVVAACQVAEWTGDVDFARGIYDSLKLADFCIEEETVENYVVYTSKWRTNKFFMEEPRSVTDENGEVPPDPKAVCDVQGFVWQARTLLAELAETMGDHEFAQAKRQQADALKEAFRREFWDEELQFPVLAIGGIGSKRHPCRVYHTDALLLPKGLLTEEQEQAVARRSREPDLFTPWGILPISGKGRVFQPFFIQSQCVCPFQTVMGGVAWFLRNGMDDAAHQLMKGLVEARQKLGHLPELYVVPNYSVGPLLYAATQMACYPQLWTAGSAPHMVRLCSGIEVSGRKHEITIEGASIPQWMGFLRIHGLHVLGSVFDLDYTVTDGKTSVVCQKHSGSATVRVV